MRQIESYKNGDTIIRRIKIGKDVEKLQAMNYAN